ncbi:hypothetical protein AALB39_15920 [Lachnospiraceae bacterium 54-53]
MRTSRIKLAVYGIFGLATFGSLTFLPQSPLQTEAKAYSAASLQGGAGEDLRTLPVAAEAGPAGWQQDTDGWKYRNSDGSFAKGCFAAVDDKWYYFDQEGYMTKGWQQVGDDWYFFDSSGSMVTGPAIVGDTYYYFEPSGKLNEYFYNVY